MLIPFFFISTSKESDEGGNVIFMDGRYLDRNMQLLNKNAVVFAAFE
jgi:hypothetical protein